MLGSRVSPPRRTRLRHMLPAVPARRWYVCSAMATAITTLKNFIDGEFVDPADGQTEPILNPATGEAIAEAPLSTAADVDRAVKAAARRVGRLGDHHPRRACARAAQARRRDRGARRRARRARGRQRRQADQRLPRRRDPVHGRQPAVLRRRREVPRGQVRRRVPERLHLDHPPRAGRRDRPDRALELPADDGRVEDRPRPGGRQHGRAQAGGDHPAHHAEDGRVRGRDLPQGSPQRDHRPRRPGRPRARHPRRTSTWSR